MPPSPLRNLAFSCLILVCLGLPRLVRAGFEWEPVHPEDRQSMRARVDSTADAEAHFWKIRVEDGWNGSQIYSDLHQHLRVQVFNDRGAAAMNTVAIPYVSQSKILDLQARVVRPDGSTIEVAKNTMLERTLVKAGGRKVKEKTFVFPDLKPGSILEYRWTERRYDRLANYVRLELQKEYPIRTLELRVRPLDVPELSLSFRMASFHGPTPVFDEAGGFHNAELHNVPAFRAEPRMPPEDAVRHWILFQYRTTEDPPPTEAWKQLAKNMAEIFRQRVQPNGDVKKAAREVIGESATDGEKVRRLSAFCRAKVRNIEEDAVGLPPVPDKIDDNDRPEKTLRRGVGTSADIQCLLVALATASGMQARLALLPDPDQTFDTELFTPYFLTESCVAIWAGHAWTFVNPAERYTPDGALPAHQEGRLALILDSETTGFIRTPLAPPAASEARRRGSFKLAPDGTLEGSVLLQYSGHWGEAMKEDVDEVSPDQREKNLREQVRARIASAELSDVRIEHASDAEGPYTVSYRLRIPGYAARVGKRLLLGPAVFETGQTADFPSASRRYPVWFPYPWAEDDSLRIDLPPGFTAETLPQLEPIRLQDLGGYDGFLASSMDGTTLLFRRRFEFGHNGALNFPPSEYPGLKKAFDSVAERDAMSVSLTSAPGGTSP